MSSRLSRVKLLTYVQVAGVGMDTVVNCLFFIAGVIPGHVHGFYITCTYFHRKSKVRKGRYPGRRATGIYSSKVWNGGASNEHVRDLEEAEILKEEEMLMRRRTKSSRSWGMSPKSETSTGW